MYFFKSVFYTIDYLRLSKFKCDVSFKMMVTILFNCKYNIFIAFLTTADIIY